MRMMYRNANLTLSKLKWNYLKYFENFFNFSNDPKLFLSQTLTWTPDMSCINQDEEYQRTIFSVWPRPENLETWLACSKFQTEQHM